MKKAVALSSLLVLFCFSISFANTMGPINKRQIDNEALASGSGALKVKTLSFTPLTGDSIDPDGYITGQPWPCFYVGGTVYTMGFYEVIGTGTLKAKATVKNSLGQVVSNYQYTPLSINELSWTSYFISFWASVDIDAPPGIYTVSIKLTLPNGTLKTLQTKVKIEAPL